MRRNFEVLLRKQGYHIIGRHSAVKLCHWMRQKLLRGRACYKETFYGIETHRCIQMTPVVNQCNQECLFCWRVHPLSEDASLLLDDPGEIVEGSIKEQRRLLSGFKGDVRCNVFLWEEAREPRHAAISLAGEPTFYPHLGELIEEYHKRKFTTFLVTNGTLPKVLEKLSPLPTQLYVTVAAPNEKIYRKLCMPRTDGNWERLMETVRLLRRLDTRTVIRHTLVKNWNMGHEEEYAKIDLVAEPDFIEAKGYVFVGDSRLKMSMENMPSHADIKKFSENLLRNLPGYKIISERSDSRVVLIARDGVKVKIE